MRSYDRVLEHLEHATQHSCEPSMEVAGRDQCWRCLGKAGSGPSGVCDRCRELLLADLPPPEPETGRIGFNTAEIARIGADPADFDVDALQTALSVLGETLRAFFDGFVDQCAAGMARIGEIMRERSEIPEIGVWRAEDPPPGVWIGTRWAENDLYERILAGEADIHCPRGPINFPHLPQEPS